MGKKRGTFKPEESHLAQQSPYNITGRPTQKTRESVPDHRSLFDIVVEETQPVLELAAGPARDIVNEYLDEANARLDAAIAKGADTQAGLRGVMRAYRARFGVGMAADFNAHLDAAIVTGQDPDRVETFRERASTLALGALDSRAETDLAALADHTAQMEDWEELFGGKLPPDFVARMALGSQFPPDIDHLLQEDDRHIEYDQPRHPDPGTAEPPTSSTEAPQ